MSTWNKFCFTGGIVEASVTLPGTNNIVGLWPAIWSMGNLGACSISVAGILFIDLVFHRLFLGRVGYGASLEGMVSKISLGKTLFLWRFSVTVADLKISCSVRLF